MKQVGSRLSWEIELIEYDHHEYGLVKVSIDVLREQLAAFPDLLVDPDQLQPIKQHASHALPLPRRLV